MPKDAKFGLIVGVGLVVLIAALFFHRDRNSAAPATPSVSTRPVENHSTATPKTTATNSQSTTPTAGAVVQSPAVYSVAAVASE